MLEIPIEGMTGISVLLVSGVGFPNAGLTDPEKCFFQLHSWSSS
jgi:hypothetical protein